MEAGRRSADALGVVGLRSGDGYDVGIFPAASRQNGSFTDLRLNAGGAYVRLPRCLGMPESGIDRAPNTLPVPPPNRDECPDPNHQKAGGGYKSRGGSVSERAWHRRFDFEDPSDGDRRSQYAQAWQGHALEPKQLSSPFCEID